MKVFLSWSGEVSLRAAGILRDWLPSVLQSVTPYVSSEDIDKGARWSTDIAKELELSAYGIICITRDNLDAPWIHFEAGALSKTVDKGRVSPFLIHVKRSEIQGPLLQFQSTIVEKDDIARLITSINSACPETEQLDAVRLAKVFEVWWPELKGELDKLPEPPKSAGKKSGDKRPDANAILEEVLTLVRNQERLLRSPETLLPPEYLMFALSTAAPDLLSHRRPIDDGAWGFLFDHLRGLRDSLERSKSEDNKEPAVHLLTEDEMRSLNDVVDHIAKHSLPRSKYDRLRRRRPIRP
jgi:hypothetical protein